MIRTQAQLPVSRFAELIGVPRRTYTRWLARHRAGDPVKGPWPAPVIDELEPLAAKYAGDWPAWGHRKIWGLMRADGLRLGGRMPSVRRWSGRCAAAGWASRSATRANVLREGS